MAYEACSYSTAEIVHCHTGANFGLKRPTTDGSIDDPRHVNMIYSLADSRQVQRQRVHDKARIDTGPQHSLTHSLGYGVNLSSLFRVGQPWEGELFSSGYHVQSRFEEGNGIRATARIKRVDKDTVAAWLDKAS